MSRAILRCRHDRSKRAERNERGAGTLLAVWVAMVLMVAGMVGVLWATVSVAAHRVAAAADLTALSAAQAVQSGDADPCSSAQRIATKLRVTLKTCAIDGETAAVEVALPVRLGSLGSPTLTSEARAGPTAA
jgi:secretion/DNA translocation related TadE-like protein